MPTRRLTVRAPLRFDAVRAELDVPAEFPAEVLAEAERRGGGAGAAGATTRPTCRWSRSTRRAAATSTRRCTWPRGPAAGSGSATRSPTSAAFVRPGGAIDAEARRRGQTLYSPDRRTPLHPPVLGEGAASLLPDQLRPAVLWTDRPGRGRRGGRGRRAAGPGTQPGPAGLPGPAGRARPGDAPEPVALLPRGRRAAATARPGRGAPPSWTCRSRRCVPAAGRRLDRRFRAASCRSSGGTRRSRCSPARCAARLMLDGGVGLLRTLPPARPEDVAALRRLAPALGVDWPAGRRARGT